MTQVLDGYKIVVAPMLYMFRAGIREKDRNLWKMVAHFIRLIWSGVVE